MKILAFLFFRKKWQFDEFEGADFKYDNDFLKFYPTNTQIRYFFVPNLGMLVFSQNFAI